MLASWRTLLLLCCMGWAASPAWAQTIVVNPNSLSENERDQLISVNSFYLSGPLSEGLTPEISARMVPAGPVGRTLLTLLALRMTAADLISLDDTVSRTLPNVVDSNPFRVAITPRHLLTETAGFAVPPVISGSVPLSRYITHVRTAGQMEHADAVGWALLIKFMEARGGAPISLLLDRHVLRALNLPAASVQADISGGPLVFLQSLKLSGSLIAETARLTVRNRSANGARFLPIDLYEQFTARQSWRMHPVGPRRTLGGIMHTDNRRTWISAPLLQSSDAGCNFMAFPAAGIVFVNLTGAPGFKVAVLKIIDEQFLPGPPDRRLAEANGLYDKDFRFSGNYELSAAPSAWLADRLRAVKAHTINLTDHGDGMVHIKGLPGLSSSALIYHKKAPFYFESTGGSQLIFSPYKQGGYLVLDGMQYRYSGILGNKVFVVAAFPYVAIFLLTSGLYMRSKISNRWRKMGQYGVLGTLLISGGALCEFFLWPQAVYTWDMPFLVNIWRTGINVGLALVLSLLLFALSFTKQNEMPKDGAIMYVPLHLGLLCVAAGALFLITVAWGIAGEFSAY